MMWDDKIASRTIAQRLAPQSATALNTGLFPDKVACNGAFVKEPSRANVEQRKAGVVIL